MTWLLRTGAIVASHVGSVRFLMSFERRHRRSNPIADVPISDLPDGLRCDGLPAGKSGMATGPDGSIGSVDACAGGEGGC